MNERFLPHESTKAMIVPANNQTFKRPFTVKRANTKKKNITIPI